MKDLGEAKHILGMRIKRDRQQYTLHLSQEKYIEKVLDRFNVADAKLLECHCRPKDDDAANYMKNVPYALACGSLMYAMVATWPDIDLAIRIVGRFMANLSRAHWVAIKSILRYLKGTEGKCLCYGKGTLELKRIL